MKKKIFIFNNGGREGWYSARALCEDGHFIAGHICSYDCFIDHDMGITSNWKHDVYDKHFPEGWDLVRVHGNPKEHEELMVAYAKHEMLPKED